MAKLKTSTSLMIAGDSKLGAVEKVILEDIIDKVEELEAVIESLSKEVIYLERKLGE